MDEAAGGPSAASPGGAAQQQHQEDRSIYFVSTAGDDGASGSLRAPWRTIQHAVAAAADGVSIVVLPGTYGPADTGDPIIIDRVATADRPLRLVGTPGAVVTADRDDSGFRLSGAAHVVISGFELVGGADTRYGTGIFITDESHDIVVRGNTVRGFGGGGIGADYSDRLLIEDNWVEGNNFAAKYQTSGISLFESLELTDDPRHVIRNNTVLENRNEVPNDNGDITDGNCVIVDRHNITGYDGPVLVEGNLCVGNGGRGVQVLESSNVVVANNTLVGNLRSEELADGGELSASDATDVAFVDNLVIVAPDRSPWYLRQSSVEQVGNVVFTTEELDESWFPAADEEGCPLRERYRPSPRAQLVAAASTEAARSDVTGRSTGGRRTVGALAPGTPRCS